LTLDQTIIWEHKLWNESLAEKVRTGRIEEHYLWQIAQQLLVSGAEKCLFMTSDGSESNMAWLWIERASIENDLFLGSAWEERLIEGWKRFAADLESYEPPVAIKADEELELAYSNMAALIEQRDVLDGEIARLEAKIKDAAKSLGAKEVVGNSFKVQLVERKGSVDYSKIPQLQNVNLDNYRKPASAFYQIKPTKRTA
ncbi:MAG: hypothetical protein IE937_12925, partial [Gammaproteobacteria bacterium]|nr:hypothetical protein [Gammaproteobacteria bacterium]